jgi:hypothetical protein
MRAMNSVRPMICFGDIGIFSFHSDAISLH